MRLSKAIEEFIEKQHANMPGLIWDPVSHRYKKPESMIMSTKFPAKPYIYRSGGEWHLQIGKRHITASKKSELEYWLREHSGEDFSKAIHFDSPEAAEKAGFHVDESSPENPEPEKVSDKPKPLPKKKKPSMVGEIIHEAGHQLSPKGPGYHSPEDITDDVNESRRIAGRIKGFLSRHNDIEKSSSNLPKPVKYNHKFISSVARDYGIREITEKDSMRAHKVASEYNDPQHYYDRLKEFFNN